MSALEKCREIAGDLSLHLVLCCEGNPVLSFDGEKARGRTMPALSCNVEDVRQLIVSQREVSANRETSCHLHLKSM
jgi:hypothetical protein